MTGCSLEEIRHPPGCSGGEIRDLERRNPPELCVSSVGELLLTTPVDAIEISCQGGGDPINMPNNLGWNLKKAENELSGPRGDPQSASRSARRRPGRRRMPKRHGICAALRAVSVMHDTMRRTNRRQEWGSTGIADRTTGGR